MYVTFADLMQYTTSICGIIMVIIAILTYIDKNKR